MFVGEVRWATRPGVSWRLSGGQAVVLGPDERLEVAPRLPRDRGEELAVLGA